MSKASEASEPRRFGIRRTTPADAAAIARLIEPAFARFIAPELGDVGRVAFRLYVTEKALRTRLRRGALAWCAVGEAGQDRPLVGYAELADSAGRPPETDHLTLLFTAVEHHGQGIARALLRAVCGHLESADPPVVALTVNASGYAVPIYERLGFRPTAAAGEVDGIIATPMRRAVNPASPWVASPDPRPSANNARTASDRGARGR